MQTNLGARLLYAVAAVFLLFATAAAGAADYRQVVSGVAIYFGILPAELVRGHPPEHPESGMHGGTPAGENHLMVALFNDKTGERIVRAEVTATITGPNNFKTEKKLEPMVIAGSTTFGHYFSMLGPGPYRVALRVRAPGVGHDIQAVFAWARS
ncbi:MAG: hypothetical protein A2V92_06355 [Candidatus Muproteobacteria bacterium RBG_16_65_31]|uniref:YtkA-like domain-containing protein n=1 Tax=Candidatus Muproteobacteria bacterium RBG_16_65_31 TaxID=1817759 RepID=A0A1F6TGP6_9PROT|nr:MAG: hypothetical protein A2V92_06355 [Candidatus Muproteobacteria bacterium RBG_16_65_31]